MKNQATAQNLQIGYGNSDKVKFLNTNKNKE